jgi:hypothetical protein
MRYAQINTDGTCEGILDTPNAIDAAHMILLPEGSEVTYFWTYDGETWTAPEPAPELTSRWIGSHRFLFTLHSFEQQVLMDAVHTAAMGLTPAQILNFTANAVDGNGYPLAALRVFRLAYEMMDKLGGNVDLLSGNMDAFLQAAGAVGIYGDTGEEIAAEITRVKADQAP